MKDDQDKSNLPTMPPSAAGADGDRTDAVEAVALMAKAYAKAPAPTAPLLTSSTLDEEDGWGAPPAEATVEVKAITDSMPTPKAFEIYQAPAPLTDEEATVVAKSPLLELALATAARPDSSAKPVSTKSVSTNSGGAKMSVPTPLMMPVQALEAPAPGSIPPVDVEIVIAPPTPAIEMPALGKLTEKTSPATTSIAPVAPAARRTFDPKFVVATIVAIALLAAAAVWALR